MKLSIIQVEREKDGLIDGYWLQDHVGSIEEALVKAQGYERANGGKIKTAIVSQVVTTTPILHGIFNGLKKLN
jgi:hypothetical protein